MSAAASFTEEECTIYIGYIRESSTTTITEATTTTDSTTETAATQSVEPITVAVTDHL